MGHVCDGVPLSHKKNEMMACSATGMDLEMVMLSEVSQTEEDKYHVTLLICRI